MDREEKPRSRSKRGARRVATALGDRNPLKRRSELRRRRRGEMRGRGCESAAWRLIPTMNASDLGRRQLRRRVSNGEGWLKMTEKVSRR